MPYRQNKRTGEWWETDANGKPIRPVNGNPTAPQGRVLTLPVDPLKKKEDARQDKELDIKTADSARQAAAEQERLRLQRIQTNAQLEKEGKTLDADGNIVPIPGWTPPQTAEQASDRRTRISKLNSLVGQINRVQELGNAGPLATSGLGGLADYNPWAAPNAKFNTAGAQLSEMGLGAFRTPGVGTQTDRDALMFERGNLPTASKLDSENQEILIGLRRRTEEEYRSLGLPPPKWVQPAGEAQPSVWSQENPARQVISSGSAMRALSGNTRTRTEDSPELAAWVSNAIDQGVPLEQINQRLATDPSGNWGFITPDAYNQARKAGRGNYDLRIQRQVPLTRLEEFSGSKVGASLAGLGNAGSFGAVERLTGDRYNDLRNSDSGGALLAGEVLGSVAASQGIGKLASAGLSRLPPALASRVLGGGKVAQFGRQVAQDATYGGLTGGIANNDAVGGAMAGGLGSAGGQAVGGTLGRFVGGLRSPTAQALASDGMVLTPGQIARASLQDTPSTIGIRKMIAGGEDAVANTPLANGMVSAARERGLEQANNRMFRAAADGAPIEGYGVSALNQLDELKGRAYDDALTGVSIPKNDPYLMERMDAINPGRAPDEFAGFVDNVLKPTFGQGPEISGRQLQDALRMLQTNAKGYRRASVNTPAFADTASALKAVEDALVGATARNAPGAIPKLKAANRLNRNLMVMDDAVGAAANNGELVTPAQVMQSIRANNSKLGQGRGARALSRSPLYNAVSQMQAVLPNKVPPTGVNAAPALGLLGVAGLGGGQAMDSNTLTALSIPMLLAGAYTKTGGKVIQNALLKRPAAARSLGTAISKHKGLFGSASLPFLLEAQD